MHIKKPLRPIIASVFVSILSVACGAETRFGKGVYFSNGTLQQPVIGVRSKGILAVDDYLFKDSDGDEELDRYEDWRRSPTERAEDLVTKMSLDEKTALLEIAPFLKGPSDEKGTVGSDDTTMILNRNVRYNFTKWEYVGDASAYAKYRNNCQELAEQSALGIPLLFVTDPVHDSAPDASSSKLKKANALTPFLMPIGLAAIGDAAVAKEVAAMQRDELRATGVFMLYGPIADLATEPRWARMRHTFGPKGESAGRFAKSYIQGLQGKDDGVDPYKGVATTVKHFPGGGPNEGGLDSHRNWGRFNVYPGNNFAEHLEAMKIALEANPAALMPNYSVIKTSYRGRVFENVPASYSRIIMQEILRDELGWDGFVTSDWGAIDGADTAGLVGMAWEDVWNKPLSERLAQWISTGIHQIGLGDLKKWQVGLDANTITEDDLTTGVIKALEVMFKVGAFENPYVDPDKANFVIAKHAKRAEEIMQQAITLLKNDGAILPITTESEKNAAGADSVRIFFDGYNDDAVEIYIKGVKGAVRSLEITEADYAIVRISARQGIYFAGDGAVPLTWDDPIKVYDHKTRKPSATDSTDEGLFGVSVEANNKDYAAVGKKLRNIIDSKGASTKLILSVYMDRPFIIKPYLDEIEALVVDFGATDKALLNFLFQMKDGVRDTGIQPTGKLPLNIPLTQEDIDNQAEDLPNDEANTIFAAGTGLKY